MRIAIVGTGALGGWYAGLLAEAGHEVHCLARSDHEVINRDGLEAFTLRACAREAGVSHAAPANHFGDLAGLTSTLATRAFERRFALADHVRVTGASHELGMLHIDLVRETPEALKPRRIEIARASDLQAKAVTSDPTSPVLASA